MDLVCVDPAQVAKVWPKVSALVRIAMQRGDLGSFRRVQESVRVGRALLWLVCDEQADIAAAVVTQLELTETQKCCVIVACAGSGMERWLPLLSKIEDFAKAEGCHSMRIMGRMGWERVLPDYRQTRVVLEKRL